MIEAISSVLKDIEIIVSQFSVVSFFSLILTTALVVLYYKQAQISKTQTQILNKQTKLMQTRLRPKIEFDGFSDVVDDVLYIQLTNIGGESASRIILISICDFDNERYRPLRSRSKHYLNSKSGEMGNSSLDPKSTDIFVASLFLSMFDLDKGKSISCSFSEAVRLLSESGTKTIELQLYLYYSDIYDDNRTNEVQIWDGEIEISSDISFQDVYDDNVEVRNFVGREKLSSESES